MGLGVVIKGREWKTRGGVVVKGREWETRGVIIVKAGNSRIQGGGATLHFRP